MSDTEKINTGTHLVLEQNGGKQLLWQATKITEKLEEMPVEDHAAIVSILAQLLNHRAMQHQQAEKAKQVEAMAAAEREAKFSVRGGQLARA